MVTYRLDTVASRLSHFILTSRYFFNLLVTIRNGDSKCANRKQGDLQTCWENTCYCSVMKLHHPVCVWCSQWQGTEQQTTTIKPSLGTSVRTLDKNTWLQIECCQGKATCSLNGFLLQRWQQVWQGKGEQFLCGCLLEYSSSSYFFGGFVCSAKKNPLFSGCHLCTGCWSTISL